MYPASSLFIAVGQLAIVILVLVSYPLQVHPCRNCLDKVFHAGQVHKPLATVEQAEQDMEDEAHGSPDMSPLKHTVLTTAIIASGFAIAYFVDDLRMGERLFCVITVVAGLIALICAQSYRLSDRPVPPPSHSFCLGCSTGR